MEFKASFDNTFARLPDAFYTRVNPTPVKAPKLLAFNAGLARDLGIDAEGEETIAAILGGNEIPQGAAPLAQLYAGHQFGNFDCQQEN